MNHDQLAIYILTFTTAVGVGYIITDLWNRWRGR